MMNRNTLIGANIAGWSMTLGIWALNFGLFSNVF